jgi:hypothetical protein
MRENYRLGCDGGKRGWQEFLRSTVDVAQKGNDWIILFPCDELCVDKK